MNAIANLVEIVDASEIGTIAVPHDGYLHLWTVGIDTDHGCNNEPKVLAHLCTKTLPITPAQIEWYARCLGWGQRIWACVGGFDLSDRYGRPTNEFVRRVLDAAVAELKTGDRP